VFGAIGMPELIIIFVLLAVFWLLPLVITYRLGYSTGYRKALEKSIADRAKNSGSGPL